MSDVREVHAVVSAGARPCPRCGHLLHGMNPGPCMVILSDGPGGVLYCACGRVPPVTGRQK